MISVIIPVLNEELALPRILSELCKQAGDFEIIVVDGGSHDRTQAIAEAHEQIRFISSCRGRAAQMNAGAKAASGRILLFLHADTTLPPDAIATLDSMAGYETFVWGGFHHRFAGDDWRLTLISRLHNLRCHVTRIFYGDQAIFIRSDTFRAAGGFPDIQFMEDIALSRRLRRVTPPAFLPDFVVTSPRKFVTMGIWKSLGRVFLILACHRLGLPIPMQKFFQPIR